MHTQYTNYTQQQITHKTTWLWYCRSLHNDSQRAAYCYEQQY